jgi:hypothetical protein
MRYSYFLYIRESYQQLRGLSLLVIGRHTYTERSLLSYYCSDVYDTTEDILTSVKNSFYEELELTFSKFPEHHMKLLLGDFTAKVDR